MTVKIDGTNTVANPAFTGADTDTGLQCGTNELKLVTGGSEAITVDSSQNVGIGTTSPSKRLEIQNSGSAAIVKLVRTDASTTGELEVSSAGNRNMLNSHGNKPLTFQTDTTERIRILGTGEVGIGTNSPAVELDVNGEVRASTGILFGTDTAADNTLDDYEEGTWTPVFAGATTAGTYTYVANIGKYTKIGNTVTVWCALQDITTSSAGSGAATVTGLPFTNGGGFITIGTLLLDKFDLTSSSIRGLHSRISTATSTVVLRVTRDGITDTSIAVTDRNSNGSDLEFCITYLVS